jgi:hypothetical protein
MLYMQGLCSIGPTFDSGQLELSYYPAMSTSAGAIRGWWHKAASKAASKATGFDRPNTTTGQALYGNNLSPSVSKYGFL